MDQPSRALRVNLWLTDGGFIGYWLLTASGLLPPEWLFQDYHNPLLQAWNWSFLPLDLLASGLGLGALLLARRGDGSWRLWALLSLALTFCAGLMALAFWTLRCDFDPGWWLPNLYLLLWPLCLAPGLLCPRLATLSTR